MRLLSQQMMRALVQCTRGQQQAGMGSSHASTYPGGQGVAGGPRGQGGAGV